MAPYGIFELQLLRKELQPHEAYRTWHEGAPFLMEYAKKYDVIRATAASLPTPSTPRYAEGRTYAMIGRLAAASS